MRGGVEGGGGGKEEKGKEREERRGEIKDGRPKIYLAVV